MAAGDNTATRNNVENLINEKKHFDFDNPNGNKIASIAPVAGAKAITTPSIDAIYGQNDLMLVDLFGRTGYFTCGTAAGQGTCEITFANDYLAVRISNVVGAGAETNLTFTPLDRRKDLDSHDIVYRKGSDKTSTMEFAYWSDTVDRSRVLKVFAREGAGDMAFHPVTNRPDQLTGSADYVGLASGYYAMGTDSSGEFTAEAMLTADFESNKVSGSIDNFQSVTNDDNISVWKLDLAAADFTDNTFNNAFTGNTLGYIKGDENNEVRGQKWNAGFYGRANPGSSTELVPNITNDYPEAVIGTFKGSFPNNGQVVGAFGTELAEGSKE